MRQQSTPGDDGFEAWYTALHPRLITSLAAAFGDQDLAAEAADEAIVRAFERWDTVAAMDSPAGWAYTCAFNVARRRLRRRKVEQRLLRRDRHEDVSAPAGEIWLVVADLPERQRLAVVLRHVGHLREADIAGVMGITRGSVSSTLRAAYASLRGQLERDDAPPVDHITVTGEIS